VSALKGVARLLRSPHIMIHARFTIVFGFNALQCGNLVVAGQKTRPGGQGLPGALFKKGEQA
jgi:hypothetical protein